MNRRLFFIVIVFLTSLAFAEENEPAVLIRGPIIHDGIEFLGVNRITAQYGEYKYQGELIRLYYTAEEIVLSDDWGFYDCKIEGLVQKVGAGKDRIIIGYFDGLGWKVFLSVAADADYICPFISEYIKKQKYFNNIVSETSGFSFPAILDID